MLNESENIERKPFSEIDPDGSLGPLNNSQRINTHDNEIEMAVVMNKQVDEILGSEGNAKKSKRSEKMSEMQSDVNTDAFSEGQASIDTLDNYVGPVKD